MEARIAKTKKEEEKIRREDINTKREIEVEKQTNRKRIQNMEERANWKATLDGMLEWKR